MNQVFSLSPVQQQRCVNKQLLDRDQATLFEFDIVTTLSAQELLHLIEQICHEQELFFIRFEMNNTDEVIQKITEQGNYVCQLSDSEEAYIACKTALKEWQIDYENGPIVQLHAYQAGNTVKLSVAGSQLLLDLGCLSAIFNKLDVKAAGADAQSSLQHIDVSEWLLEEVEQQDSFWSNQGVNLGAARAIKLAAYEDCIQIDVSASQAIQLATLSEQQKMAVEDWIAVRWAQYLGNILALDKLTLNCYSDGRQQEVLADIVGPLTRFLPIHCDLSAPGLPAQFTQQRKQILAHQETMKAEYALAFCSNHGLSIESDLLLTTPRLSVTLLQHSPASADHQTLLRVVKQHSSGWQLQWLLPALVINKEQAQQLLQQFVFEWLLTSKVSSYAQSDSSALLLNGGYLQHPDLDSVECDELEAKVQLAEPMMTSIVKLCQQHNLELFEPVRAAFACVLASIHGQDQVSFIQQADSHGKGLVYAGIGANIISADLSASQIEAILASDDHLKTSQVSADNVSQLVTDCCVNTAFIIADAKRAELSLAAQLSEYQVSYDLVLTFSQTGEVVINANPKVISKRVMNAVIESLQCVLSQFAQQPKTEYSQLTLTSHSGEAVQSSATEVPNLLLWFKEQASVNANKVAVADDEIALSYKELDARSDLLACLLVARGVNKEMPVGIMLSKGANQIVAMLAVLKSGACYVPLDLANPTSRNQHIVQDSKMQLCLCATQEHLTGLSVAAVLLNDTVEQLAAHLPALDSFTGEELAYIIYTSGTTGKPKGVEISHRNLASLFASLPVQLTPKEGDSWLMLHSFAFDFSVWEIWGALLFGGRVYVPSNEQVIDLRLLSEVIEEQEITVLNQTPSAFYPLIAHLSLASHSALRMVIFGGEKLQPSRLIPWFDSWNDKVQLVNMYGITEVTVHATYHLLQRGETANVQSIIGSPLPDMEIIHCDHHGRRLPGALRGELWLSGNGIAKGYWGLEDVSKAKFVSRAGKIYYRSGDLGYKTADQQWVYCSRADSQVQIRGFRIELGEVRHALEELEDIQQAEVTTIVSASSDAMLVALVKATRRLNTDTVETQLAQSLPDYMIPKRIIQVESFKRTVNGKLDLERVIETIPEKAANARAMSAEEAEIAAIWCHVLGLDVVTAEDNFFNLGGHSLLATEVVIKVGKAFDMNVPLVALLESPTVAGMAQYTLRHRNVEQEQTAQLMTDKSRAGEPFPLTDIQHAYRFGSEDNMEMGEVLSSNYREIDWRDMNVEAFSTALNSLIKRHDMLRVVIVGTDQQKVLDSVNEFDLGMLDLRLLPEPQREAALLIRREQMLAQKLNSATWPLFDVKISQLADQDFRVHVIMNSLIVDAWSEMILSREFMAMYEKNDSHLPELTLTFRDYVLHQNVLKQQQSYKRSRDYWQQRLETFPERPALPLIQKPEQLSNVEFVSRRKKLGKAHWAALKEQAAKLQVSPTSLLLTCYADVLGLWSECAEFVINLTLFNRAPVHNQVMDIVGDFTTVNLLAVDTHQNNFIEAVQRLQKRLWQDLDHKDYNGIEVVRALATKKGSFQDAIMPVVFTSTLGMEGNGSDDLTENFAVARTAQVWLDHAVAEADGELFLTWSSVDKLFPDNMMEEMFNCYFDLLERVAQVNEDELSTLAPMMASEQRAKRAVINNTEAELPSGLLHQPLLAQSLAAPERIAVIQREVQLSYGQLLAQAIALAKQLQSYNLSQGELVGVVMAKSWKQVPAVLAIQLVGGAYLPVDANLPQQRRQQILEEGQARCIIVEHMIDDLPSFEQYTLPEHVDDSDNQQQLIQLQDPQVNKDDLAYVIFTSGSTGKPKGVMITHGAARNTIEDINQRFNVTDKDTVLGLSALNFDLSVYDIFGVLGAGGRLVLPADDENRDPGKWLAYIEKYNVTIWNTVPALMQMLVEYSAVKHFPQNLRVCMLSGDWINVAMAAKIKQLHPHLTLTSLGGATEASIWSIAYDIEQVNPQWSSIPYGKPLLNQGYMILNENMANCPDWVKGDLYITGKGLAKGYWNDKKKTEQHFLQVPAIEHKLYKTGDKGRYLPDGNIQFLGREDNQVKVRGYRIELEEIEHHLLQQPQILSAKVVVVNDAKQRLHLAAYICAEQQISCDNLRLAVAQKLPDYMVPTFWRILDKLPLGANGKVDLKRLPAIDFAATSNEEAALSNDAVLNTVMRICCELLEVNHLHKDDNLIMQGADSIMVTKLLVLLKKSFDIELPIAPLFANPTVDAIATLIKAAKIQQQELNDNTEDTEVMEF
ncbi:D-alanine--D-alanyl carrier protein ligase [Pseudoalteromonas sp. CIP111854]|uniref:D-alanine--D-alanyl carrier protein ligase n=1 Tax=Pseudoalteromonas holothuriae TaxID=2963714 RepID=A0A9W4QTA3_9GAMM|nr:non-ribosomal peptide synthetase [Pseudoalteromonas sp. CIP111854]CAH9052405.1 D-alanine--D-alanyl carrier protein ligase [Pseudoalteromonas sp. CIP111854]